MLFPFPSHVKYNVRTRTYIWSNLTRDRTPFCVGTNLLVMLVCYRTAQVGPGLLISLYHTYMWPPPRLICFLNRIDQYVSYHDGFSLHLTRVAL